MNANKQDAGGLLPDELEAAIQDVADHANSDGDFVSNETERATENLRMKIRAYGELCRAAPAGGDVECFVREMRTSKGSEFFVVVRCNGRELTPHMYAERWKAEYDVASWQHLLCGAPEPDLLAYGPSEDSAPAGSGEVDALVDELILAARANARSASSQGFEMTEAIHLSYEVNFRQIRALSRGVPEGNQAAVDSVIRQYCRTCGGCGEIGGHSGQTPESYEEWSAPCPDCSPAAIAAQRKEG